MHERVPPASPNSPETSSGAAALKRPDFPVLRPAAIMWSNLWHRKRSALNFSAADLSVSLSAGKPDIAASQEAVRHIGLTIGRLAAFLTAPVSLIARLLESYGLSPAHPPKDHALLLLMEHRFAEALQALEERLKLPIALKDISLRGRPATQDLLHLDAQCRLWERDYWVRLSVPEDLAVTLINLFKTATASQVTRLDIPVPAAIRLAVTRMTLKTFQTVRLGDVILADALAGPGVVFVVLGERFAARARWQGSAITLIERPVKIPTHLREVWSMADIAESGGEPEAVDAEFDDLQIKLVFELGRRELRLGDLRQLLPGYVFDLNRPSRTAVDIYAGARRVGSGEIVQVNETLGVRVTRLFNNE